MNLFGVSQRVLVAAWCGLPESNDLQIESQIPENLLTPEMKKWKTLPLEEFFF